jgi:cell wall-associated NlpC family hydrolase
VIDVADQREAVIKAAESWLGTPYHSHGRIKGSGVDCATLIIESFAEANVIENIFPGYSPEWHLHRSEELYVKWVSKYATQIDAPARADLIIWRFGRTYSHAAIYLGNDEIIHSYKDIGCSKGSVRDHMFVNRPFQVYSVWGTR